ncbi:MAG: ABC transporter permease [Gemmatimonadetes bacterium]|nr:MAG: ABC transporter permease [Gemmatimonadota bacterium]
MLFLIAWRNIWRSKLRSLVIMFAIALGLWGGLFVIALSQGMVNQRMDALIETSISHLQIHHPQFADNQQVKWVIPKGQALIDSLRRLPEVRAAAGRTVVMGMVSSAAAGSGVQIDGIIPAAERQVSKIYEKITEGAYFDESVKRNPILIGKKLATKLKVNVRSKIILTLQDRHGNITAGAFRVVGIFETISSRFDEHQVYVRAEDLNHLLDTENAIHEIALILHDVEAVDPVATTLRTQLPALKVETWKETAPELDYINEIMNQTSSIFMLIILVALAFGIINTMLMAILERVRELGMLMAVGMNKFRLFSMILLETLFLAATGGIVGTLVSMGTVWLVARTGIDLSVFAEGLRDFGYDTVIYPVLAPEFYLEVGLMVFITAILSALYPAWKALKLHPAEAIRTI